jgi:ABC-type polysaccharide/polyol phosphate transport system ATPase subunit
MSSSSYSIKVEKVSKLYRVHKVELDVISYFLKLGFGPRVRTNRPTNEILALDQVSFELQQGDSLGIIGPNGAGKSTLLKILSRVTFPTQGRVLGRGRVVPLLEMGAAFNRELSAKENIYLSAALFGIPDFEIKKRLDDILTWAELDKFAEIPISKFSSGMYIRLAFSMAINLNPDILIADEILAVGDLAFKLRCGEKINELTRNGTTLLLVSHDMQAIQDLTKKSIFLAEGRIQSEGFTREVVSAYEQFATTGNRRRSFSLDEQLGTNSYAKIYDVEVTNSLRSIVGKVDLDQEFWIRVPFGAFKKGLLYSANIDFYRDGMLVFGWRSEPIKVSKEGVYICWTRLPSNFLIEGTYNLNVSVFCKDVDKWHICKKNNALAVSVIDSNDRFSFLRAYGLPTPRNWMVGPKLESEYTFLE